MFSGVCADCPPACFALNLSGARLRVRSPSLTPPPRHNPSACRLEQGGWGGPFNNPVVPSLYVISVSVEPCSSPPPMEPPLLPPRLIKPEICFRSSRSPLPSLVTDRIPKCSRPRWTRGLKFHTTASEGPQSGSEAQGGERRQRLKSPLQAIRRRILQDLRCQRIHPQSDGGSLLISPWNQSEGGGGPHQQGPRGPPGASEQVQSDFDL